MTDAGRGAAWQLHPSVLHHVVNTMGWSGLRPTQQAAVAPLLAGEDVVMVAPTAGGKTEAAMLPLLSRMAEQGWTGTSILTSARSRRCSTTCSPGWNVTPTGSAAAQQSGTVIPPPAIGAKPYVNSPTFC